MISLNVGETPEKQTILTVVDNSSGKIIKNEKTTEIEAIFKSEQEPEFLKLYLNRLGEIQKLPASLNKVLLEIAYRMPFANDIQDIVLNKYIKEKIANNLNVTLQYVNDSITYLVKTKLLKRVGRGAYSINPFYIARGKWQDIKELQLTLIYSGNREQIASVNIVKKDGSEELVCQEQE